MKPVLLILFFSVSLIYAQEYNGEILSHVSHYQASKGKLILTDTIVYQINNRMGEHLAEVSLLYSKGEKVTIGETRIEDRHGRVVRKLKNSEIKDLSAVSNYSLYEDDFIKTFTLKHNDYPYRLHISYKRTVSDFMYIVAWGANRRVPTREKKIVVEVPADYPVRYDQKHVPPPVIETVANNVRYEWNAAYIPVKREVNAPVSELKIPGVRVVPLNFRYGITGSWESWQTFGDWVTRLNAKSRDLPDTEKKKIDALLQGVTDVREKIKILYYYLQDNTRYVNVKIDIGGFKTYPASYVSTNKYGDCKALCNYMQSMLEYAGIKAYYTLVRAGDEVFDLDINFPSQVFNHIILTVPLEADTVFLECTSKNIPAGYTGTFTQGRKALIVDGSDSRLIDIPSLQPEEVLCTRHITTSLNSGTVPVTLKMTQRGDAYNDFMFLASDVNRNQAEKYIRDKILSGTFNLTGITFEKHRRDRAEIDVITQITMQNVVKKYGNNLLITPFAHEMPAFEPPGQRTQSLSFDYPLYYCDTIVYRLTDGIKLPAVPEDIDFQTEFGHYTLQYDLTGHELLVRKNLFIRKGSYSLEQYPAFHDFITKIKTNENKSVYINMP